MKKFIFPICFGLLIMTICITSCIKETVVIDDNGNNNSNKQTIVGSGDLVSHKLSLSAFSKISLTGQAKITVTKGDSQSVVVRAQQNIFDVLEFGVSDSKFNIGIENNYDIKTDEGVHIDIVNPGAITDVFIVGSGELKISGNNQESFNIMITGAGNIDSYDLDADNVNIIIAGAASCKVKANKTLDATISGAGTIKFKGNPKVTQSIAGVGSIINDN